MHHISTVTFGTIEKKPIVDPADGQIKAASIMRITGCGDHRYGDAAIMLPYFQALKGYIEDPENWDPTDKKYKDVPHHTEV